MTIKICKINYVNKYSKPAGLCPAGSLMYYFPILKMRIGFVYFPASSRSLSRYS